VASQEKAHHLPPGGTVVRWWSMRPAQNLKPATYRCPFCGERLRAKLG
jgi:hypothetical protein